jgi:filamentous hemagglutinin
VFNLEVDAEHVYYVSTAGVLVHNAYPGSVVELEVGTFGDLARRSARDGLTPEHIPSFASVKANVERQLGRQLTAAEEAALRNQTNAIVVPTRSHMDFSRTYGGRNSPQKILEDSLDQQRAFQLDRQAWRQHLLDQGHMPEAIDHAFRLLDDLNRQAGRY